MGAAFSGSAPSGAGGAGASIAAGAGGVSYLATAQFMAAGMRHFGAPGFAAASARFDAADDAAPLAGRTVIVTGANAGLGFAAAAALARRAADVHIVCRSRERGEAALAALRAEAAAPGAVTLHVADLSSAAATRAFAREWLGRHARLDALVNNAGVLLPDGRVAAEAPEGSGLAAGLEAGMATALCGSYLLTGLLLPALLRGGAGGVAGAAGADLPAGRVVNVSSGGGLTVRLDVADLQCERRAYDGTVQYAHAKRAQMELTELWAARLRGSGVAVLAMHPGWASTEGVRKSIPAFEQRQRATLRTPAMGADTIVWLAGAPDASVRPLERAGQLFLDRAPVAAHFPLAGTRMAAGGPERLWAESARACGWAFDGSDEEKEVAAAVARRSRGGAPA